MKVNIIAEIGINHNGDKDKAKRLINIAKAAGCDFVKLQKRTPEICVPDSQKDLPKMVPWRRDETTYLQYKKDIEFSKSDYQELHLYASKIGIKLFSSVWDIQALNDVAPSWERELGFGWVKIPSALLTDDQLLQETAKIFSNRILSTGMSTEEEIEKAVKILDPNVIFHTTSIYPCRVEDLNLGYITFLKNKYPDKEIGFSNHFFGITPCFAAVALGATWIEVHVCESHDDWGSDQSSSVEPVGLFKLVKGIRDLENSFDGNHERKLHPGEKIKRNSLRKN